MNIKETFLKLTERTYPHGTEQEILPLLSDKLQSDEFGNLFIQIGDAPSVMFTSHLDTATSALTKVNHVIENNIIKTDGKSILGADDKAGVTIMLYMIENGIPGLYYFFLGEEVGCKGSKKLAEKHRQNPLHYIKKVISFDRRGTDSVITFQSSERCCSDEFGKSLADQLNQNCQYFNYKLDPTGIYTDSVQFTGIYSECTNISVGYQNEHTWKECQDIEHLERLANTCLKVDWENLPAIRNPKKQEFRDNYYNRYPTGGGWDWDWEPTYKQKTTLEKKWFFDKDYQNHISYIEIDTITGLVTDVDLSKERIESETWLIKDYLQSVNFRYRTLNWDGQELKITGSDNNQTTNRKELSKWIEELNFWKRYLKYKTNSK